MIAFKIFLPLLALPAAMAMSYASLLCENGVMRTISRSGELVPCYNYPISQGLGACTFETIGFDSYFGSWSSHDYTDVTNIICEHSWKDADSGICYTSNHDLVIAARCSSNHYNHEAVVTVVEDNDSRRLGAPKIDFGGKQTKEFEVGGERWVAINQKADEGE